jgi:hypothetical protein
MYKVELSGAVNSNPRLLEVRKAILHCSTAMPNGVTGLLLRLRWVQLSPCEISLAANMLAVASNSSLLPRPGFFGPERGDFF